MGYKYKPMKGALKRFKVTKTGKVKRRHAMSSHLRSGRPSNKKRALGRPAILSETLARNIRLFVGKSGLNPNRVRHERAIRDRDEKLAAEGQTETAAAK